MTNDELSNDEGITKSQCPKKKYDLEERTALFGEQVVRFARKIPESSITRSLINQLIRAATSVGANYCEADDAFSKKEFIYKIATCRKEAKETKHWLRMIIIAYPRLIDEAQQHKREAQELNLIFSSIVNKTRKGRK
ncbi:MAG: four helix bundle protein [Candidatus Margulisbacteria bacterium]|nr:four helix bundle protein [Candidatus Margulisiibacteriota bacterium]